jgi:quinol monooxygenase YgiN
MAAACSHRVVELYEFIVAYRWVGDAIHDVHRDLAERAADLRPSPQHGQAGNDVAMAASPEPVLQTKPDTMSSRSTLLRREAPSMTTITKGAEFITLINVFTVDPINQQQLIDLLVQATEVSVRSKPGFISSSLHKSLDGSKVTMYAQWRSAKDYQAMREDPAPLPYLQQALTIAKFEPGIYEVVEIFLPLPASD